MSYLKNLKIVADSDVAGLKKAEKSYGDSWKKRGGVGAFMMLARKWDRLENAMTKEHHGAAVGTFSKSKLKSVDRRLLSHYDIFARTLNDQRKEGLIDDIRDLRRYLLLVEAELLNQGLNAEQPTD